MAINIKFLNSLIFSLTIITIIFSHLNYLIKADANALSKRSFEQNSNNQINFLSPSEQFKRTYYLDNVKCKAKQKLKILQGNDDGWAEANIRALYKTITKLGHQSIISSPTENKSGTGKLSRDWKKLSKEGQYGSIKKGSEGTGSDLSDDRIWYVNAFPVDGIRFGLDHLSPKIYGSNPDMVITGPNVGKNIGLMTHFSGTFNAARYATKLGIPSISISVDENNRHSYKELRSGDASYIYANATIRLLNALLNPQNEHDLSGGEENIDFCSRILPYNCTLNVNLQEAGQEKNCKAAEDYKFVLTSLYGLDFDFGFSEYCDSIRLKGEFEILGRKTGCWATISVVNSEHKFKFNANTQRSDYNNVLKKLKNLLSCP
ncbi:survival protein sure-like phosphatase/nucleotidase [Phakopsora pachyrhizi]|uniref:Survival protein sure-like phosphatase/nucleotidase n=1 Tax=Phakopsora pachyrhizi TaxID=170000 RepID=A0AAV0ALJ8_PHAPC|nr:survival protein sure-like phosphatase/nucleotidase [Phakopsora pachyrhizi]CAH7668475.1 survival protein sure-like phosphatase/nucleotidase [Phakopsora pachyrhizi]